MYTLIDEIIILTLCLTLLVFADTPSLGVVVFLCAIILVCICQLARTRTRFFALSIACICPLILPGFIPLLGLVSYMSLHERNWPCRLMWVFSLAGVTVLGKASFQTIALVWLLCGLATLLAIRDIRSISELAGLRFAYDDARERYLNMQRNTPTPTKPDCDYFSNLTKRELAIVRLVAQGKDNHEIATELFLSEGTVRNHISSVLAKKNLSNRTQLAVAYYQETSH